MNVNILTEIYIFLSMVFVQSFLFAKSKVLDRGRWDRGIGIDGAVLEKSAVVMAVSSEVGGRANRRVNLEELVVCEGLPCRVAETEGADN